jgi:uncharacterized damage-inducible protein DinB
MSRLIVEGFTQALVDSADLISKLIDECPPDLWNEKAGKWPIWQHVLHASDTSFFFPIDQTPLPAPLTAEELQLDSIGTQKVDKAVIRDYFKANLAKTLSFIEGLTDSDLPKENTAVKAYGLDWTIAKTLAVLPGHYCYHLGNADAVLRSHGHNGIF